MKVYKLSVDIVHFFWLLTVFFIFSFLPLPATVPAPEPITILSRSPVTLKSHWVHQAVFNSLLRGLTKIKYPYVLNPDSLSDISKIVYINSSPHVLSDIQNYKLKNPDILIAIGPNISFAGLPKNLSKEKLQSAYDLRFIPCAELWDVLKVKEKVRNRIWYAGVDEVFWNPSPNKAKDNVLIYFKPRFKRKKICEEDLNSLEVMENILTKKNLKYSVITYKYYNTEEYKQALDKSFVCIYLARSESQGIALAESWAMDVPTLVFNTETVFVVESDDGFHTKGMEIPLSSAPYLSDQTGSFWKTPRELENLLDKLLKNETSYSPRNWVLNNMTDAQSARLFIKHIEEFRNRENK